MTETTTRKFKPTVGVQRRGLRWGQLLSGLEQARAGLEGARRGTDLLSMEARAWFGAISLDLSSLEQAAWAAEAESVRVVPRKKKRKP